MVPQTRIQPRRDVAPRRDGRYVLYWMDQARRPTFNHALARAFGCARHLGKPLVVLETVGHRDDPRGVSFALEGLSANFAYFAHAPVLYYPFYERLPGSFAGLVQSLGELAAVVVCDLPRDAETTVRRERELAGCETRCEQVDSEGILPVHKLARAPRGDLRHLRAWARAQVQLELAIPPSQTPLDRARLPTAAPLPARVRLRWPGVPPSWLRDLNQGRKALAADRSRRSRGEGGWVHGRWLAHRETSAVLSGATSARKALRTLDPWLREGYLSPRELLTLGVQPAAVPPPTTGGVTAWHPDEGCARWLEELIMVRELLPARPPTPRQSRRPRAPASEAGSRGLRAPRAPVLRQGAPEPKLD